MNTKHESTSKKVWISILVILLLFVMFVVTTYAFVASFVTSEGNLFETAKVDIDLNGGVPVFTEDSFKSEPGEPSKYLEPGRMARRTFTVTNNSTIDVYYRLYLTDIVGSLQDVLTINIYDEDENLLYSALMSEMTDESPFVDETILKMGETKNLIADVTMDPRSGNIYQNEEVCFSMVADATQVRNNSEKIFE